MNSGANLYILNKKLQCFHTHAFTRMLAKQQLFKT